MLTRLIIDDGGLFELRGCIHVLVIPRAYELPLVTIVILVRLPLVRNKLAEVVSKQLPLRCALLIDVTKITKEWTTFACTDRRRR